MSNKERERERERVREREMVYSSIIELDNLQYAYTEHFKRRQSLLWMRLDCFSSLSYKTALIRATESECIPRGDGALAGWAMLENNR